MSEKEIPLALTEIRPPNPYDFSSLCEFLEKIFLIPDFTKEYGKCISLIEQHENQDLGDKTKKDKSKIVVFTEDQFELAMIRALFALSDSLISFKQLSSQEQDNKREFLAKDNYGNVKNALTSAGFPDSFGRAIMKKNIGEFNNYNLAKSMLKVDSVFSRAFYFTLKENELTKKSIDELIVGLKQFIEASDLRQYLETLLYKVEVTSTERSFESMKKKVAVPLKAILDEVSQQLEELERDPKLALKNKKGQELSKNKLENKAKIIEDYCKLYFNNVQGKVDIIKDFYGEYFSSDDFIFVEKNLIQFSKSNAQQTEKNNKAIMSDDYIAGIESKLMIQMISATKKAYNSDELHLLKCHILRDLVGNFKLGSEQDQNIAKFTTKKKLLLDSLKRIRLDIITEDTRNGASDNKKIFLEEFEKNLLQLSPEQLKNQTYKTAAKRTESMLSSAKRKIDKKKGQKENDAVEQRELKIKIDVVGLKVAGIIIDLYKFKTGQSQIQTFQNLILELEPRIKVVVATIKKIENPTEQDESKVLIKKAFAAFFKESSKLNIIDAGQKRMYVAYMKGFVDRIAYW
jgi:hypothetical protein